MPSKTGPEGGIPYGAYAAANSGKGRGHLMKFKIAGVVIAFAGLILIAKYDRHFVGLLLIFIGFFWAMKKVMKPV